MPVNVDSIVGQIPLAIARLTGKTPVASAARTAEYQRLPLELRDRAFWSSGVTEIQTVASMRAKLDEWATFAQRDPNRAFMDRSKFVAEMRAEMGATQGDSGSLTDIASRRRLELIYDFQTTQAAEYAKYVIGSDPAVLDMVPAQELVRVQSRKVPRDWLTRWQGAGGRLYGGRMIALKNDPVWVGISAFGTPFPPFDFGSGMGVADVERADAVALGVISADYTPPQDTPLAGFNDNLKASIANLDDIGRENLRRLFGDQVVISGDTAKWQGNIVGDLFDATQTWSAAGRPQDAKPSEVRFGAATPGAVELARKSGMDIKDSYMALRPDDIVKTLDTHGIGAETRGDQRPVTRLDFEVLPHVWRRPDFVVAGNKNRSLIFTKNILGQQVAVLWQKDPNQNRFFLNTMYAKKEPS
jgi:hypothetical protein